MPFPRSAPSPRRRGRCAGSISVREKLRDTLAGMAARSASVRPQFSQMIC